MKNWSLFVFMIIMIVGLVACGTDVDPPQVEEENKEVNSAIEEDDEQSEEVVVELKDVDGVAVGTATVKEAEKGVVVAVEATHIPAGVHGFHIHQNAVCEGPDFESAGGHFNPEGTSHGFDHAEGPHAGDLPNLEVEADGSVKAEVFNKMVTLDKNASNSLFTKDGTSLIIHADADDGESQPAGNAGARIVCGVISQ